MDETIAVYLNKEGKSASLYEPGSVKIYRKNHDDWHVVDGVECNITKEMGLKDVRKGLMEMTSLLGSCKIFVGRKVNGLVYNILEGLKFNLWEFEGKPEEFLEYIYQTELNENKECVKELMEDISFNPIEVEEGHYYMDLKSLQETKRNVTSKQALLPFLSNQSFYELTVRCSHIPPWFERKFDKLGLQYDLIKKENSQCEVKIYHSVCK